MIKPTRLTVSDFDSTLFDVVGFTRALPEAVEAVFGISSETYGAGIKDFYIKNADELVGYDLVHHLASHNIDLYAEDNKQKLLRQILAIHKTRTGEPDLLYPDARKLLDRWDNDRDGDLAVATVNLKEGYEFKRGLCGGRLDDVRSMVVDTNKGRVLSQNWAGGVVFAGEHYESARVVDDGPTQVEALPVRNDVERIQIVRPGQRYPRTTDDSIRVIASLDEL
ncbi:MAG TPA: hypothetical protein VHQ86_05055 [Candidatus Saccharimonadia bacterium]|nr:hypothetical protein [Candidatus Saccharimonadia bacterium]